MPDSRPFYSVFLFLPPKIRRVLWILNACMHDICILKDNKKKLTQASKERSQTFAFVIKKNTLIWNKKDRICAFIDIRDLDKAVFTCISRVYKMSKDPKAESLREILLKIRKSSTSNRYFLLLSYAYITTFKYYIMPIREENTVNLKKFDNSASSKR